MKIWIHLEYVYCIFFFVSHGWLLQNGLFFIFMHKFSIAFDYHLSMKSGVLPKPAKNTLMITFSLYLWYLSKEKKTFFLLR